jgi:hypothetical protein
MDGAERKTVRRSEGARRLRCPCGARALIGGVQPDGPNAFTSRSKAYPFISEHS